MVYFDIRLKDNSIHSVKGSTEAIALENLQVWRRTYGSLESLSKQVSRFDLPDDVNGTMNLHILNDAIRLMQS